MRIRANKIIHFAVVCVAVVVAASASASVVEASKQEVVKFQLKNWKSAHFDDAKSAQDHHDTLKKIGCEAKLNNHKGHFDVSYRCPKWKSISLKSHKEAHQWEKWLKLAGFATTHKH